MSVDVPGGHGVQVGDRNSQFNLFVQGRREDVPKPGPVVIGNVPQAPLAFQMREEMLAALRSAGPRAPVVYTVTGMRGAGKTEVAAAYARECIDAGWRLIAWVNAEGIAETLAGLAIVADRLGIARLDASLETNGKLVRGWLESDGYRCLVVFDNVTDLAGLRPYIPAAGRSQVVLTSSGAPGIGRPVVVDVFTEEQALAFLVERTGRDEVRGARDLARAVGHLPLALAQAAAVLTSQHLPYPVYLERLRSFPLRDYLAPVDDGSYPRGLAEAVLQSMDAVSVSDRTGLCSDLLGLVAVLSPAGVSRDLLHQAEQTGTLSKPDGPAAIDEALGRLAGASLLSFSRDGSTVTAHRLVTRVARERHAHDGSRVALTAGACKLLRRVASSIDGPWLNDRSAARDAASHIITLSDYGTPAVHDDNPVAKDLLALRSWALWCLNRLGDSFVRAIEVGEPLLADSGRVLGNEHPDTLTSRDELARVYEGAGRLDEAIALHEQVLADRVRVLGDEDLDTLTSRNNLAFTYCLEERPGEAIPLLGRVLAGRTQVLGGEHPDTQRSRDNLFRVAGVAALQGEAILSLEQTLADLVRALGEANPDALYMRYTLALAYQATGRPDEAIPLLEQALAGLEPVLGADRPVIAGIRRELADARR